MTPPTPPIRRLLVTGLAVVSVLGALTACSGTGDDATSKATTKPSASASSTAKAHSDVFSNPPADIDKTKASCTDGKAVIDQANKDVTLGDCASVQVTAGNAVIHLGNVEELVVTGSINDISAKTVGSVKVTTDGNRVTSDNKPKVDDDGKGNFFVTR
ncbi:MULTISPECIES: DUF3060 domain-containing protein [unclassified Curtobacterium]|uniref:DUF3060 domain-containing protein n=1 Tax=unclassified Curtobacterium TaxID=257496 RepID=UPI0008DE1C7C|nr:MULTISPECIES: DUF3060 domain-containing protein [unclassified Curtobacterium]OIH95801.1 hypothetical protein BIU92_04740 [Curtobacterium sp. MCBA15_003]OII15741.1 hypothetical protein BIU97_13745 [Curtobacterium sp. MCBA15_009]OII33550.1 hypothetical protein BIU94_00150 [Curtobacterium sp. MMLR14_006]